MISPIETNGTVLRMQDFSTIRHNEENHAGNQHLVLQDAQDKAEDTNAHTVQKKADSDGADTHHDAREEGRNKYIDTRKKKDKNPISREGVVIAKQKGGFDISI